MKNIVYYPLAEFITDLEAGGRPRGGGTTSGDIVSLGAEHLNDVGGFDFENLKYIPNDYFEEMNKGIIQKDDILIVKDGATTGKVAIVREGFPYKTAAVNEHLFILRVKEDKLEPNFLFYFLFSGIGQSLIMRGFHGSAQGGITKSFIDNIRIPVLDLPTQRRVISVLKKAESTKQKRQETLWLADEFLKSVFLEMFGDPVRNPKGWGKTKLSELADVVTKGTTPTTYGFDFVNKGIKFLKIENISKEGDIEIESIQYITPEANEFMQRSQLKEGDIIFSIAGALGRTAIISKEILPANINQALSLIRLRAQAINLIYLSYLLRSGFIFRQIEKFKRGVAQLNLNLQQVGDLDIVVPSRELQQKFADLVQKVEQLKTKQRESEKELDNLFNSLMQKAFKGELRCAQ